MVPLAIKLPSTATARILTAALEISLSQIFLHILKAFLLCKGRHKDKKQKKSTSEMVNLQI